MLPGHTREIGLPCCMNEGVGDEEEGDDVIVRRHVKRGLAVDPAKP